MIAMLRGSVVAAGIDWVVLDVGGVGYRVAVPGGSVPTSLGAEIVLHTHLAVREDAMALYGFADAAARDLFERLLGVSGIGPRIALAAVATLGADGVRRAVATEDIRALTAVPGIGRKGAQRLVLELRAELGAASDAVPGGSAPVGARAEARDALAALGYTPAEVAAALGAVVDEDAGTEELVRGALRALATS